MCSVKNQVPASPLWLKILPWFAVISMQNAEAIECKKSNSLLLWLLLKELDWKKLIGLHTLHKKTEKCSSVFRLKSSEFVCSEKALNAIHLFNIHLRSCERSNGIFSYFYFFDGCLVLERVGQTRSGFLFCFVPVSVSLKSADMC